jgi:HNH endonuclease
MSKQLKDRLLKHVIRQSDGHWLWTACLDKDGYGIAWDGQRKIPAHVLSYRAYNNDYDSSLNVLHKCDIRRCVNPDCLFQGTQKQNMQDMIIKNRHANQQRTHCKMGHPLTNDNIRISSRGWRQCLICRKARIIYDNSLIKPQG